MSDIRRISTILYSMRRPSWDNPKTAYIKEFISAAGPCMELPLNTYAAWASNPNVGSILIIGLTYDDFT